MKSCMITRIEEQMKKYTFYLASILCFTLLGQTTLLAQECTLTCAKKQISVNGSCEALITPAIILTDETVTCDYRVIILDLDDNIIAESELVGATLVHPTISLSDGTTFKASVEYTSSIDGKIYSCWNELTLEDKLGPEVYCLDDVTVHCTNEHPEDLKTEITQVEKVSDADDASADPNVFEVCINLDNQSFPWELIDSASISLNLLPASVDFTTLTVNVIGPDMTTYPTTYNSSNFVITDLLGLQAADELLDGKWTIRLMSGAITEVTDATITIGSTSVFLDSPASTDNCSEEVDFEFLFDQLNDVDCEDDDALCAFERIISYRAIDASGNPSPVCNFTICYSKPSIFGDDFEFPPNVVLKCELIDEDEDGLPDTEFNSWDSNENGYPDPSDEGVGFPTIDDEPLIPGEENLCKIAVTFNDVLISVCGNSTYKIVRTWTVLDWCESESRTWVQTIKVEDDKPPVIVCPTDGMEFLVDQGECTTDLVLDPLNPDAATGLQYLYDCSSVSVQVEYLVSDGSPVDEVTDPFTAATPSANGTFTIHDIPVGVFWIKYVVSDECGNSTECRFEAEIVDQTPPYAICDQFTAVALSESGWARAYAISFDDGSYDACGGPVTFEVKRNTTPCNSLDDYEGNDLEFGPYVQFCCADAAVEYVEVVLQVSDSNGNKSSCTVNVQVQDKFGPYIHACPQPTITLDCNDYDPDNLYGVPNKPSVSDNCVDPIEPKYEDNANIDGACKTGTVTRRWFYELGDEKVYIPECTQTIVIVSDFDDDIDFPLDKTVECVDLAGVVDAPTINGVHVTDFASCASLAYTYEDQVFAGIEGLCAKIKRTHTVIDWCVYVPNNGSNAGFYQDVQIIKVANTSEPEIQECAMYVGQTLDEENCLALVRLNVPWGYDQCIEEAIAPSDMAYNVVSNGQIVEEVSSIVSNSGTITLEGLPKGDHVANFWIYNSCGNVATCSLPFSVTTTDTIPPVPYCLGGITTVLMEPNGDEEPYVEIWASDFNLGSLDNCTDPSNLSYTFENGSGFMDFECGEEGLHTLKIFVTDECGNSDFCETSIIIQANNDLCDDDDDDDDDGDDDEMEIDSNNARVMIAGSIFTEENKMINDVAVALNSSDIESDGMNMTDLEGHYLFEDMLVDNDYIIEPTKDIDYLNGISTLDLVFIQKHILGVSELSSPYKLIAADANNSQTISAIDLIELRKLILGIYDELPDNQSWRFVDSEFVFADPTNPWPFSETIDLVDPSADLMTNDFVAVKIGDVNNSASVTNLTTSEVEARSIKVFNVKDESYTVGQEVYLPLEDYNGSLLGIQFELNFDFTQLQFEGIENMDLSINESNYSLNSAGKISFSWNDMKSSNYNNLFKIKFTALADGQLSDSGFTLNQDRIAAELYTNDSESSFEINFNDSATLVTELRLIQNKPNPFSESTTIGFYLPEASNVALNFVDFSGKSVYSVKNEYQKGLNEIVVKADQLKAEGLIYYQLETEFGVKTKKLLLIK